MAFVGTPHRIGNQPQPGSQVSPGNRLRAVPPSGADRWVLYLEGSTDLAILRSFAARLGHAAALRALERPFVRYVGNRPSKASDHYYGLPGGTPALRGVALFEPASSPCHRRGASWSSICGSAARSRTICARGPRWSVRRIVGRGSGTGPAVHSDREEQASPCDEGSHRQDRNLRSRVSVSRRRGART